MAPNRSAGGCAVALLVLGSLVFASVIVSVPEIPGLSGLNRVTATRAVHGSGFDLAFPRGA
jgi:hypothetical protein